MKVLITADIHIGDYSNYNYDYRSRLKSYSLLADRLGEIGHLENCQECWILGDLIDKPNSKPYVLHEANKFMNKICESFEEVKYILGNHDLDSKSQSLTSEDSLITVFDHDNLKYVDRQVFKYNGHYYGFMNWRPDQSLDWLEDIGLEKLDILFGHYTKSELFGQEIDESKFDLCIHGDIHNSQVIGKFVSVCNPIQKDMSSEKEGKVIIFDTDTMEWKRVLVDPDHTRFLQIEYTTDQSQEGFHGPLEYMIYRPENIIDNKEDKQLSFTWNDIDDLINQTCTSEGLEDIHSEIVSKCEEFSEIDFNFQLNYLKIHGYRSIEDLELHFNKGDRIALLGSNGSGKSSIIGALKGIFLKNSDLKWEQSDFTEDMRLEVKLTYQNKEYHIWKGSSWGLSIDGQEQSYSGIRAFESDLIDKLPFLQFLDLFFLDSNVSSLSEQFSANRRIELISKFYRLDRIDAYYKTALRRWNETNDSLNQLRGDRNVLYGVRDHIQQRLSELQEYSDKDPETYQSLLNNYNDLRDKKSTRDLWEKDYHNNEERIQECEDSIKSLETRLTYDVDQGKKDLIDLKEKASSYNKTYEDTYQKSIQFESELKELNSIEAEGVKLRAKLDGLKSGVCPECGSKLEFGKSRELISQCESELKSLGDKWDSLYSKLQTYPNGLNSKESFISALKKLKSLHSEVTDSIELISNKITNYEIYKKDHIAKTNKLDELLKKRADIKQLEPEKIEIPFNLSDLISDATTNLNKVNEYRSLKEDFDKKISEIEAKDRELESVVTKLDRYSRYMELTSNTGIIYEQILTKLAEKFTTPEVKYEVDSGVYRGSRFIEFNSFYLVRGKYRSYWSCSAGQKTVCDLDFLEKLFSVNIGMLILDEYLKHLDDNNFSKICDTLMSMNVNTIILCTHDDNLTAYTRRLLLSLDDLGKTVVNIM